MTVKFQLLAAAIMAVLAGQALAADKFIAVGGGGEPNGQFTAAEFEALADFDVVRIPKFHGRWDRALHHEAARTLKALNPAIEVHAYFSMSYRFAKVEYGLETWSDDFYLRDLSGNLVPHRNAKGYFVDLSNPDYRRWALGVIQGWMAAAPYDAIHFDSTNLFETEPDIPLADQREDWVGLLGAVKVDAWNDGLVSMLIRAHGVAPAVTYNGIARKAWRFERSLGLLVYAGGAMNEGFGWTRVGVRPKSEMFEDVQVMRDAALDGSIIFQKANVPHADVPDPDERERLARYLLGVFMLGWEPGFAFFKFGDGYSASNGEIDENAVEADLPLGAPLGIFGTEGPVFWRAFEGGWVFVNMEQTAQSIVVPAKMRLANGGVCKKRFKGGRKFTLAPESAAFFMRPKVC